MLQAFVRVKPVSVGKLYAVYVGIVAFVLGLALDLVAVVFGRGTLTVTLQMMSDTAPVQQNIVFNPLQILLVTCLLTLLVMVLGFFYGVILSFVYNIAANITGGVVLESNAIGVVKPVSAPASISQTSSMVVAPKLEKKTEKAVVRKSTATRKPGKKKS